MKLESNTFRIELRSAKLCMELDCSIIFDARMYRQCPTCGGVESYPLEAWLNRERSRRPARIPVRAEGALKTASRSRWFDRLRGTLPDPVGPGLPAVLPLRAQRRAV